VLQRYVDGVGVDRDVNIGGDFNIQVDDDNDYCSSQASAAVVISLYSLPDNLFCVIRHQRIKTSGANKGRFLADHT